MWESVKDAHFEFVDCEGSGQDEARHGEEQIEDLKASDGRF